MSPTRAWISVLLLSVLLLPADLSAHLPETLLGCPVFSMVTPRHPPARLRVGMAPNGLVGELYDVTGDGRPDLGVYTPSLGGLEPDGTPMHTDSPLFVEVDEDGDEFPDTLYIDVLGTGACQDVLLYHRLDAGPAPRGGLVLWQETRQDLQYDGRELSERVIP